MCVYIVKLTVRPVSARFRVIAELDSLLTCTLCRNTCTRNAQTHTEWKVEGRWHKCWILIHYVRCLQGCIYSRLLRLHVWAHVHTRACICVPERERVGWWHYEMNGVLYSFITNLAQHPCNLQMCISPGWLNIYSAITLTHTALGSH